jgi:hypothetical protein
VLGAGFSGCGSRATDLSRRPAGHSAQASDLGCWILRVGDEGKVRSCAGSIKQALSPFVVRRAARTGVDGKVSRMDGLAWAKQPARWWYWTGRPIEHAALLPCCVHYTRAAGTPVAVNGQLAWFLVKLSSGHPRQPPASPVQFEFHVDLHVLSLNVRLEGHQWRTNPRPKGGPLSVHFLG